MELSYLELNSSDTNNAHGRVSIVKNHQEEFLIYTPPQGLETECQNLAHGFVRKQRKDIMHGKGQMFNPVRKAMAFDEGWDDRYVDHSKAFVEPFQISFFGQTFNLEIEHRSIGKYDNVTGMLLTRNAEIEGWLRMPEGWLDRMDDSLDKATLRKDDIAPVFDGETLSFLPVTQKGEDILASYEGKEVTAVPMVNAMQKAIAIKWLQPKTRYR